MGTPKKFLSPYACSLLIESLGYLVFIVIAAVWRDYLLDHLALVALGVLIIIVWGVYWKRRNLRLIAASVTAGKSSRNRKRQSGSKALSLTSQASHKETSHAKRQKSRNR